MSKITVQVSDSISVAPDTIVMNMCVNYESKQYDLAFNKGVALCKQILDVLSKYTNRVELGSKYVYERKQKVESKEDNKTTTSYEKCGYTFDTLVTAKFPQDFNKMGNLLNELEEFKGSFTVHFSYGLDDTELYKNRLLEHLMNLASTKATVLAKASGLTIKGVSSIQYNKPVENMSYYSYNSFCDEDSFDVDGFGDVMNVENAKQITLTDSVTVSYKVKG